MNQTFIPDTEAQQIKNIISVISDPKKYEVALKKMQDFQDQFNLRAEDLKVQGAAITQAQKELDVREKALVQKQADLQGLQDNLQSQSKQLDKLSADLALKASQLTDKESLLAQKIGDLSTREGQLSVRERAVAKAQADADKALADALGSKTVMEAKLAQLKAAMA